MRGFPMTIGKILALVAVIIFVLASLGDWPSSLGKTFEPVALGLAGPGYALGAVLLAVAFLRPIWAFCRRRSIAAARRVLRASLVYLPGVLAFLVISKYWLS